MKNLQNGESPAENEGWLSLAELGDDASQVLIQLSFKEEVSFTLATTTNWSFPKSVHDKGQKAKLDVLFTLTWA
jgi:hypothetical protein